MAEETFDRLYGNKGIDTPYEREKITYRPDLRFSKESLSELIRPEVQQSIERARRFTISHNLLEYDELIAEVEQMLKDIEERNSKENIATLRGFLDERKFKEVMEFEKENSGYMDTGDYELYTVLFLMKESMKIRRDFIDNQFRTQFTNETEIEKIQEAELAAIDEWEQLEGKVIQSYKELAHHDEDSHPLEDNQLTTNMQHLTVEMIEMLEKQKRNRELLHTSLADTSYIHRNRYFMFLEIVEKAKILTYHSNSLIENGLRELILSLHELPNLTSPKAHLILQFRKLRDKHNGLKGRLMTIDDEKETFASEKQYMYQQLEVKTIEPIKNWMFQQEEGHSDSLDLFSTIMISSMKDAHTSYNEVTADLLNFYRSEADFYDQQITFLKNKEEIRKFYRILEDLEDVNQIHGEWVDEYLKVNGYKV